MMIIKSNYGELKGVVNYEVFGNGILKSCIFNTENCIKTQYGDVVPQHSLSGYGNRQKKYRSAISFYINGQMKSVALEKQTAIHTPLGNISAELVTFYENGSLRRVFPLNGKIDGFWSEENEGELAERHVFDLSFGRFEAKIIGMQFYQSGALKSVTLWPGEKIQIETPIKKMTIRNGFSLYEDGNLKSVEPAGPTKVTTCIGEIMAFDKDALGIHGDTNSLNFTNDGQLISLISTHTGIQVVEQTGKITRIEPREVESIIDETELTIVPIKIQFDGNQVVLVDGQEYVFNLESCEFSVYRPKVTSAKSCSNCSSCNSCG